MYQRKVNNFFKVIHHEIKLFLLERKIIDNANTLLYPSNFLSTLISFVILQSYFMIIKVNQIVDE